MTSAPSSCVASRGVYAPVGDLSHEDKSLSIDALVQNITRLSTPLAQDAACRAPTVRRRIWALAHDERTPVVPTVRETAK